MVGTAEKSEEMLQTSMNCAIVKSSSRTFLRNFDIVFAGAWISYAVGEGDSGRDGEVEIT